MVDRVIGHIPANNSSTFSNFDVCVKYIESLDTWQPIQHIQRHFFVQYYSWNNPTHALVHEIDEKELKRVIRHLQSTKDLKLKIQPLHQDTHKLKVYSDA